MWCPICRGYNTGKTENNIFYCSHCLLGFSNTVSGETNYYYIDEEGSFLSIKNKKSAEELAKRIREEEYLPSQLLNQFLQDEEN